jgi:preprotein translocase subunit Sec61beta
MPSLLRALIVFALLCGSTAVAFLLKSQLLETYTETGALESMSLIISFLVTIAAIVIGLLINATKGFIDTTQEHWAMFAGHLIRLDQSLCNYGSDSEPMRKRLQSFTAAGILNFWRADTIPTGVNYPNVRKLSKHDAKQVLSDLLNRIELGIIRLKPHDPLHERLAADCFDQYKEFARGAMVAPLGP